MNRIQIPINKLKNNKTLINGSLFAFFSFINQGVAFFLLVILARFILPAEYGKLSLFNTVVQFIGYFVALSTPGFLSVSFFKRKGDLFRQDVSSIVLITVGGAIVVSIVLLLFDNPLSVFTDLPPLFLWFALIICFTQVFFRLFLDYLRVQEKVVKYGLLSCGIALANFILSIYLVVVRHMDWEGRVYAYLVCSVIFGLLGFILLARSKLFTYKISWDGIKMILLWGIPLVPHEATLWIKQGCDRFIINGTHTMEDVGIFSFALTMTSVVVMMGTAFNATNSVSIYQILSSEKNSNEKKIGLKKQLRNIGFIYLICYIFIVVAGFVLVPLLLPKYTNSLPYFLITSISGFLQCIYFLFVNFLFYYNKNHQIMMVTLTAALIHLGLSLLFTRYSLYYTAIIYVISQSIVLYLISRQSVKLIRERLV